MRIETEYYFAIVLKDSGKVIGEIEDDEGCPHIWMKKELSQG